ncbi:MAG: hypothetical protein OEY97_05190 [Nitrospirota bacterium]|nr:hypothetical protein [Nitrospirota bacterium]
MSRDSDSPSRTETAPDEEFTPAPDEVEEQPSGPDALPEADPEYDLDAEEEDARSYEQDYMTKGMIILVVLVVGFMFAVWSIQWSLLKQQAARPETSHDITTAVSGLHRAMHGQGVRLEEGPEAELAAWLRDSLGAHARLPDLSAAGLHPVGVRDLKTGTGFGFIRYRGDGGDLLVVMGPKDMILVPADAVARQMAGTEVWLQETPVLRLVYVPGRLADWALVAAPDQGDLPAVAEVLLAGLR